MRISVRVHPKSSAVRVVSKGPEACEVWVTAPPADNQANEAVREALAEFFSISKSRVRLVRGARGRSKIFDVI
jgi:uncharacterized protein YggU (UPF0235/DUF167 family)